LCRHICAEPSSVPGVVGLGRIADQIDPHLRPWSPCGCGRWIECSWGITLCESPHRTQGCEGQNQSAHPAAPAPLPSPLPHLAAPRRNHTVN
jgi:hypothetical protein